MTGILVYSKAGHDKGEIYMVVGEEKDFVLLSDGRTRGVERPKRKNKKHVQPILAGYDREVGERIKAGNGALNEEIKKVIKDFKRV